MGYGITIIICIMFLDLIVYLGAAATNNSSINPPLIATLQSIATGDYSSLIPALADWSQFTTRYLIMGLIIGGIVAMSLVTGSVGLTGIGGSGFGITQVPMLIGVFMFLQLATIPNFSAVGFPSIISAPLYAFLGILEVVGIYGVIKGE